MDERSKAMRDLMDLMPVAKPELAYDDSPFWSVPAGSVMQYDKDAGFTVRYLTAEEMYAPPEQSVEAATRAEHDRIVSVLESLRPAEQPYTRREWAIEQRGELRMFEKILAAIQNAKEKSE